MQRNYTHGVKPLSETRNNNESRRVVVVFRDGSLKYFYNESGASLRHLQPRPKRSVVFGRMPGVLEEGHAYTRSELLATCSIT